MVIVPAVVLLIPAVRLIPTLLKLRVKLRLYRWYRALLLLDRELLVDSAGNRDELLKRLDGERYDVTDNRTATAA